MRTGIAGIVIRETETSEDRERLFRFRYAIYVEEMARTQKYADHLLRRIEEPFDRTAANFIALAGETIVGCIRWNGGRDTDFAEYVDFYAMQSVGKYFPERSSITTKFMVAPQYRRSALAVELGVRCYTHARHCGTICDFMDCNPHLEREFFRFGYRPHCDRIAHPEYGDVQPMLLLCVDYDYLRRQHSPFAAVEAGFQREPEIVKFFNDHVFQKPIPNVYAA